VLRRLGVRNVYADHVQRRAVALVSGRHLTWYGPSLVDAPAVVTAALAAAR